MALKNKCATSGRVPKELANLTNLGSLSLSGNELQMPDGAPTDSDGYMDYRSREAVAAFQACLKRHSEKRSEQNGFSFPEEKGPDPSGVQSRVFRL